MNIQPLTTNRLGALAALRQYKAHRDKYDARDWEIERIYRAISKGKVVIDALSAIREAGLDEKGRPRLAICRADATVCRCEFNTVGLTFGTPTKIWSLKGKIFVPFPNRDARAFSLQSAVPRIPPQHRPAQSALKYYDILWEANWIEVPTDPYLLRRIGKAAWVVVAAWDLTPVEIAVVRAYSARRA